MLLRYYTSNQIYPKTRWGANKKEKKKKKNEKKRRRKKKKKSI